MNKLNYQKELEKTLYSLNTNKKLLLHSCCGPCSTYCLEYLGNYFEITVLFFNPNIYPFQEFDLRVEEQKKVIQHINTKYPINLIIGDHDPNIFYNTIKGYEHLGENSTRCEKCYMLRLQEAAFFTDQINADFFTTTLTISPHKDSHVINQIGLKIAKNCKAEYLVSDFKKKNGFKRSVEWTNELNIYRQEYCGCVYSKWEAKIR